MTPTEALSFMEILWPRFVREEQATFIEPLRANAPASLSSFASALDAEAYVNHVHILDLLDHAASLGEEPWWNSKHADFARAERLGVIVCEAWAAKLARDFPEEDYAVFYTRDDNPVVRFHRIRGDGEFWLDLEDSKPMFESGSALLITSTSGRRVGAV
jgi:hypothetical protein